MSINKVITPMTELSDPPSYMNNHTRNHTRRFPINQKTAKQNVAKM